MSLWHCKNCTTAYSVGAEKCPHCSSTEHQTLPVQRAYVCEGCETPYRIRLSSCPRCRGTKFKETSMAKITKAAGATNADLGEVTIEEPAVETRPVHEPVVTPEEERPVEAEQEDDTGAEVNGWDPENVVTPDDGGDPYTLGPDGVRYYEPKTLESAPDYNSLTVAELREELDKRDLSTAGLKAELVERLTDDDAIRV